MNRILVKIDIADAKPEGRLPEGRFHRWPRVFSKLVEIGDPKRAAAWRGSGRRPGGEAGGGLAGKRAAAWRGSGRRDCRNFGYNDIGGRRLVNGRDMLFDPTPNCGEIAIVRISAKITMCRHVCRPGAPAHERSRLGPGRSQSDPVGAGWAVEARHDHDGRGGQMLKKNLLCRSTACLRIFRLFADIHPL